MLVHQESSIARLCRAADHLYHHESSIHSRCTRVGSLTIYYTVLLLLKHTDGFEHLFEVYIAPGAATEASRPDDHRSGSRGSPRQERTRGFSRDALRVRVGPRRFAHDPTLSDSGSVWSSSHFFPHALACRPLRCSSPHF